MGRNYLLLITYYLLLKSWMGRVGEWEMGRVGGMGGMGGMGRNYCTYYLLLITYYLNLGWGESGTNYFRKMV